MWKWLNSKEGEFVTGVVIPLVGLTYILAAVAAVAIFQTFIAH